MQFQTGLKLYFFIFGILLVRNFISDYKISTIQKLQYKPKIKNHINNKKLIALD